MTTSTTRWAYTSSYRFYLDEASLRCLTLTRLELHPITLLFYFCLQISCLLTPFLLPLPLKTFCFFSTSSTIYKTPSASLPSSLHLAHLLWHPTVRLRLPRNGCLDIGRATLSVGLTPLCLISCLRHLRIVLCVRLHLHPHRHFYRFYSYPLPLSLLAAASTANQRVSRRIVDGLIGVRLSFRASSGSAR
jgi:hypothetical protein